MSNLDLNSGYYEFGMALADRSKTVFLTKYGLSTQMAMGLCNAPVSFQRANATGIPWHDRETSPYHLSNLVQSFERLRKYNLKFKPQKCHFFQR